MGKEVWQSTQPMVYRPEGMHRPRGDARVDALDGLRGLAVLAVVAYHLRLPWFEAGFLGVDLFFVISGFLITHGLLERRSPQGELDFAGFYRRRLWRLYPAALVMILLSFPLTFAFAPEVLHRLASDAPAGVLYLSNAWQLATGQSYAETMGREPVLLHLWSLAVEMHYYLVWPIVMVLMLRHYRLRMLAGLSLLLAGWSAGEMARLYHHDPLHANFTYLATHTHAMGMLVGSALGCLVHRAGWMRAGVPAALRPAARLVLPIAGFAALVILGAMTYQWNIATPMLYEGGFLLASCLAATAVLSAVAPEGRWARLLGNGPLRWLGKRSYSIYLWHWPLFIWVCDGPADFNHWKTGTVILLSAACGEVSYRFIEQSAKAQVRQLAARFSPAFNGIGLGIGAVALVVVVAFSVRLLPARADIDSIAASTITAPAGQAQEPESAAPVAVEKAAPAPSATALPAVPEPPALPDPSAISQEATEPLESADVTIVGDSVMLGAAPYLRRALPRARVHAQVGRQFSEASRLITQLRERAELGQTVVLHLGTNGYIVERQFRDALRQLQDRRRVVVVDVHAARRWTLQNNEIVNRVSKEFPNVIRVHWESIGQTHPHYFVQDGIHPNLAGITALTAALAEATGIPLSPAHVAKVGRANKPGSIRGVQKKDETPTPAASPPEAPPDRVEPGEESAQVP